MPEEHKEKNEDDSELWDEVDTSLHKTKTNLAQKKEFEGLIKSKLSLINSNLSDSDSNLKRRMGLPKT